MTRLLIGDVVLAYVQIQVLPIEHFTTYRTRRSRFRQAGMTEKHVTQEIFLFFNLTTTNITFIKRRCCAVALNVSFESTNSDEFLSAHITRLWLDKFLRTGILGRSFRMKF